MNMTGSLQIFGHIDRLEQLTLVGSSVSETCNRDSVLFPAQFVGKCNARAYWHLSAHDTISALEALFTVVEVHGAPKPVVLSHLLAHQLPQHLGRGGAPDHC